MANDDSKPVGGHVGVVGTGALGLLAIKNLKEQDLEVTAFEQNDHLGGLWHFSPRPDQVTALPMTSFNTSKQMAHITDFPFTDDDATHPTAKSIERYLEAYAKEFDLLPHIKFSTKVSKVERDDVNGKWVIHTHNTLPGMETGLQKHVFDRVVLATGIVNTPMMPDIKGIEKFEGEAKHSIEFKDPYRYSGKNVLLIGIGATSADTQSFLKKANARSITISHRQQFYLVPKMVRGNAFDHSMTRRALTIFRSLGDWWPRACAMFFTNALDSARRKAYPWLSKHPSFVAPRVLASAEHRIPVLSNDLAENLRDGITRTVPGVKAVTGPKSVTFTDGTVLDDIDAIIICTGYEYDFSVIKGPGDPTDPAKAPDHFERINATRFKDPHVQFARLYRGFLSEEYPESLAFIGHFFILKAPFVFNDLVTMALASLWSGEIPLPSPDSMTKDINRHYDTVVDTLGRGPLPHLGFRMFGSDTYTWLNKVAGTGVTERVGCFSMEAWKLWWSDRKFYNLLMDGADSPAVYRLFETGRGRKAWPGARDQILKANREVKEMGEEWRRNNNAKSK
ncbi:hypothetical protein CABS01_00809 [Colletotrichum abscissum]|uniref:Monooxygenase aurF n=1 Tax=Colletotrichum abscissum TaxID=1671311 RepID=A0A9P9X466_9PEZI|nr:uncharacterized protein CABS01_00809 [Colletotrichum abscissum]KAI3535866.1 hypothetical protein CABS02_12747 [Colletotrichum abscissum]KAK1505341.1 hypothetical protein CABS01_00809 [Colletotrichum abscissum]